MLRAFNPAGGGGGGVSGTGTPNKVAKWTLASTLGDSLISDDGTTLGVGSNFAITAATGNLSTANGAVAWTLATNAAALNISSGLLSLDTTNGKQVSTTANFGVGAAVGTGLAIGSLTLTNGGTGYTNGTYSQVALTTLTGTGTGATADIVVAGGIVTTVVLRSPGQGYAVNDTLSCASIGAGANFVLTVATVTNYAGVTGDLYATRIGAGTTRPETAIYAAGAISAGKYQSRVVSDMSLASQAARLGTVLAVFDTQSESGGVCVAPSNVTIYSVVCTPRVDMSASTITSFTYGAYFRPMITAATSAGSTAIVGGAFDASFDGSGITGKTLATRGVIASSSLGNLGAGNTVSFMRGIDVNTNIFTTTSQTVTDCAAVDVLSTVNTAAAQTITNFYAFRSRNHGFSGAAHAITNFYGIKIQAPSLSGGATITNRWGISQEDSAANNLFAGVSIIGSGEASASPVGQTLRGPSGSGSNIAGGSITIAGGNSTGSGAGGSIVFQTAAAGGAGSGANTLTTRASIDSAGNLAFNSGFGSAATAYGCRAWVNFNGTGTVAIRSSGNVTSITDNGVGDYTVNMTNAMSDANYAIACSVGGTNGVDIIRPRDESTARTTTAFRLLVMTNAFAPGDSAVVNAMVVR